MRTILRFFTPLLLLMALFGALAGEPATAGNDDCTELLFNGDMENVHGWIFPSNRGEYSSDHYLSPTRSARLGAVAGGQVTFSSLRQDVNVPEGAQLLLKWHIYPRSEPFDGGDRMLVSILDAVTAAELRRVWTDVRDDRAWVACSYDVSAFRNRAIKVNFSVMNDAQNGFSEMYVDDVSLLICNVPQPTLEGCLLATPAATPTPTETATPTPAATATPTPITTATPTATPTETATPSSTPTATLTATPTAQQSPTITATATPTSSPTATIPATATPTATPTSSTLCRQLVSNPDFDRGSAGYDDWTGNLLLTTVFQDRDGLRLRGAWFGGASASDHYLYQDIDIPADAPAAALSYWWALNPDAGDPPLGPDDALTVTLRRPGDEALLQTLQIIGSGAEQRRWRLAEIDLSAYRGQQVRLHFAAVTDLTAASWHLDLVKINTCLPAYRLYAPLLWREG